MEARLITWCRCPHLNWPFEVQKRSFLLYKIALRSLTAIGISMCVSLENIIFCWWILWVVPSITHSPRFPCFPRVKKITHSPRFPCFPRVKKAIFHQFTLVVFPRVQVLKNKSASTVGEGKTNAILHLFAVNKLNLHLKFISSTSLSPLSTLFLLLLSFAYVTKWTSCTNVTMILTSAEHDAKCIIMHLCLLVASTVRVFTCFFRARFLLFFWGGFVSPVAAIPVAYCSANY